MEKLSLDALKERAGAIASNELLSSISGGTSNSCHTASPVQRELSGLARFCIFMLELINNTR